MKKLWALSLVFLLLGNAFDGLVTNWGVQVYGIYAEANPRARSIMLVHGLGAQLADKLIIAEVVLLLSFLFILVVFRKLFGQFYGTLFPSIGALILGMGFFLGGLSWLMSGTSLLICLLLMDILDIPLTLLLLLNGCPLFYFLRGKEIGGLIGRLTRH